VRNILGDILNQNYVIDPGVGGSVTIRTSSGHPEERAPSDARDAARMNGATMVFDDEDNLYRIVPAGAAGARPRDADARQQPAQPAAGLLGADRAAALRERARDAAAHRAVREGRAGRCAPTTCAT
jgi:general secretion pathway protein D